MEFKTIKEIVISFDLDEETTEKLKKIQEANSDEEDRHFSEDCYLCEVLENLGFKKLVEQYWKTKKWWA